MALERRVPSRIHSPKIAVNLDIGILERGEGQLGAAPAGLISLFNDEMMTKIAWFPS